MRTITLTLTTLLSLSTLPKASESIGSHTGNVSQEAVAASDVAVERDLNKEIKNEGIKLAEGVLEKAFGEIEEKAKKELAINAQPKKRKWWHKILCIGWKSCKKAASDAIEDVVADGKLDGRGNGGRIINYLEDLKAVMRNSVEETRKALDDATPNVEEESKDAPEEFKAEVI